MVSTVSSVPEAELDVKYDLLANADSEPEKWHAAREGLITASDVPIILGLWQNRTRFWYQKMRLLERPNFESAEFEFVGMGKELEPTMAEFFARRTGRQVVRQQQLVQSRVYPWLGATCDYLQVTAEGERGPLELKSTGAKHNWPDTVEQVLNPSCERAGEPHLKFQAQLQAQLLVLGVGWGSVAALIGSPFMHFRHKDYALHAQFSELILEKTHDFWQSLQVGIPPEPDDSEATARALRQVTVHPNKCISLPDEAREWHREMQAAEAIYQEAARRAQYYENLILNALGPAEFGSFDFDDEDGFSLIEVERAGYTVEPKKYRQLRYVKDVAQAERNLALKRLKQPRKKSKPRSSSA